MDSTYYIGKNITAIIDRPKGSKHPRHEMIYPINYGYVPNTVSGDGHALDVYVLGVNAPIASFQGVCIAVIRRHDEDDDKLIVVPSNMSFSDAQILKSVYFQEQYFSSTLIRQGIK